MNDLEILELENISDRVYNVYCKYKPYICNQAKKYTKYLNIDFDDFLSSVYEWLYYFVGLVEKEKIVDFNKFSYFIQVRYSVLRVVTKLRKELNKEISIDSIQNESEFFCKNNSNFEITDFEINSFKNILSERERKVLEFRIEGKVYREIVEILNVSRTTLMKDSKKIQKKFISFFGYATWLNQQK